MSLLSETDITGNIELVKRLSIEAYPGQPLLASLSTVQAILEGGLRHAPPSVLAIKYNNLFGIKGLGTGMTMDGKYKNTVILPTHEYYAGEMHEVDQRFVVNASVEDSILQHKVLLELPRYSNLKDSTIFEVVAHLVKADGYATDPGYPQKLIDIYEELVK